MTRARCNELVGRYDDQGFLLRNERDPARRTLTEPDILNPGASHLVRSKKS